MKVKKPRKCSVCKSTEHRADYHGSAREREDMQSREVDVPPDVALHTMVIPEYALWLVCEGAVGEALANCTRALVDARRAKVGVLAGDTMMIALAELDKRSRDLDPAQIALVRELRRKRDEADVAYMVAATKITEKLGYPPKK